MHSFVIWLVLLVGRRATFLFFIVIFAFAGSGRCGAVSSRSGTHNAPLNKAPPTFCFVILRCWNFFSLETPVSPRVGLYLCRWNDKFHPAVDVGAATTDDGNRSPTVCACCTSKQRPYNLTTAFQFSESKRTQPHNVSLSQPSAMPLTQRKNRKTKHERTPQPGQTAPTKLDSNTISP